MCGKTDYNKPTSYMADIKNDSRNVLTLDARGTNMVFGAMKGRE